MIKKILYLFLLSLLGSLPQTVFAGDIGLDVGTNYTRMTISGINSPDLFQYLGIRWIRTLDPNLRLQPIKGEETNILAVYPYNCKDTSEEKENAFIKAVINNPSVKAVEIGNEPNIEETDKFDGQNKDFDCPPEVFGDQVIRMYNQLNPSGRQVIFGGLFIKDSLHANLYNMNPGASKNYVTPYITQVMAHFRNKRTNPWDAIGLHFYVNEDGSKDSSYVLSKYQSYIAEIRKITGSLPIWVTEYGWRSDYAQMSDTKQAEFLKVTSNWFKANENVEMAFWYSQIDSAQHDIIQTLGIYDAAQELLKPSFFALKNAQGSLTACAEAQEQVACLVAGPQLKSCTWCSSKKSCVDAQDAAACPQAPPPPAAGTAATLSPLDKATKQAEQTNTFAEYQIDKDFSVSRCIYLSNNQNNCNTAPECSYEIRTIYGTAQPVCLPKDQNEDMNILQIGVTYFSPDFQTLNTKFCKKDDIDCRYRVLINCLNNKIKSQTSSNFNINSCATIYSQGLTRDKVDADTCNNIPEDLPGYNPKDCFDNNKCNDGKSKIADADYVVCAGKALQTAINMAEKRAEEAAAKAAANKAAGAPSAAPLSRVGTAPTTLASDFCSDNNDVCWGTFDVCKGPDIENCMANYGYGSRSAPKPGAAVKPVKTNAQCNDDYHAEYKKNNGGRDDYYCDGSLCVLHQEISNGIGGCTQGTPLFDQTSPDCPLACQKAAAAGRTAEQCTADYIQKHGGTADYYCDSDNTCSLHTEIPDGNGSCREEVRRNQDPANCNCGIAEAGPKGPTPQEALQTKCHTRLINRSDQTDCLNNFQGQADSCSPDDVTGCIDGLTAEWIEQKLNIRTRINAARQICSRSQSCYQRVSDACTPEDLDQRDQTSFNNCVEDFKINNPIKDRNWQINTVNAMCGKYFGPDNQISSNCVSNADLQCQDNIIEGDFISCVDNLAQNMGAVKGQKMLYKVSINCPAEEGYAGEKIIYLNNQSQDQNFAIPENMDQLVCELKEYYANFTANEDGVDENGNKLQTVIFTNKEVPAGQSSPAEETPLPAEEEAAEETTSQQTPDERRLNLQLKKLQRLEGEGQGCTYDEEEPVCPAGQKHTCHGVINGEGICVYKEGVDPDCTPCE